MAEWHNFVQALRSDRRLQVFVGAVLVLLFLQAIGVVHLCKFIRDYQGLIGTLVTLGIGFWSVNKTLRGNTESARERREEEIVHDRETVRATILAELTVLHRVLVHMLAVVQVMTAEGKFWIPRLIRGSELTRAYFAVIDKVRLLCYDGYQQSIASIVGTGSVRASFCAFPLPSTQSRRPSRSTSSTSRPATSPRRRPRSNISRMIAVSRAALAGDFPDAARNIARVPSRPGPRVSR
jgi:hypothetical protein